MRIMVVDDLPSARIHLLAMLQGLGFRDIVEVENGSQALTRLRSDRNFDVILMDWKMPVMTGPEALSVMKFQGIQIPIIMITGQTTPENVERMLKLGIKDYILKPVTIDALASKIRASTSNSTMGRRPVNDSAGSVVSMLKASKKLAS